MTDQLGAADFAARMVLAERACENVVPVHARNLITDAVLAGHTVDVGVEPDRVSVRITVTEGEPDDVFHAAWWIVGGAWRYRHGTDGWNENMTLTALRSFTT